MTLKTEYRESLLHALEHFMVRIQFSNDYYLETKLAVSRKAIEELKSDMVIDMTWIYSNTTILLESIPQYRAFLKRMAAEAIPGDECVETYKEENLRLVQIESKLNKFRESVMNSNHV